MKFKVNGNQLFFLLTLIAVSLYSSSLSAQDSTRMQAFKRNEVYVSYGTATVQEFAFVISDALATALIKAVFDRSAPHTVHFSGALGGGYFYHPSKRVAVGFSGAFEEINVKYDDASKNEKWVVLAISANGRLYYISKPGFQLYSGIGLGYLGVKNITPSHDADGTFTYQANLLGLRVGRNLALFGEIGFGYQGLLNGGVSIRF